MIFWRITARGQSTSSTKNDKTAGSVPQCVSFILRMIWSSKYSLWDSNRNLLTRSPRIPQSDVSTLLHRGHSVERARNGAEVGGNNGAHMSAPNMRKESNFSKGAIAAES